MAKKIYTNDDIQDMLMECNENCNLKDSILKCFSGRDKSAMADVFEDGYYERFDRYDSDVCEQFIKAYEKCS